MNDIHFMDDKIVTLEIYYDPMLAEIIRGRLEANGIDCFIADNNMIGVNPLYTQALGGIKLRVFERDVDRCNELLALDESLQITDEPITETTTSCPYCHSTNVRYGAATIRKTNWMGIAIMVMAFIALITFTYPIYARKAWHCFNCGNDFE